MDMGAVIRELEAPAPLDIPASEEPAPEPAPVEDDAAVVDAPEHVAAAAA